MTRGTAAAVRSAPFSCLSSRNSPSAGNARCLWIGSSTGSFLLNLASFDLEAVLHYQGEIEVPTPLVHLSCLSGFL